MTRYRFTIALDTLDGEEAFTVYLEAATRARETGENVTTDFERLPPGLTPTSPRDEAVGRDEGLTL